MRTVAWGGFLSDLTRMGYIFRGEYFRVPSKNNFLNRATGKRSSPHGTGTVLRISRRIRGRAILPHADEFGGSGWSCNHFGIRAGAVVMSKLLWFRISTCSATSLV